MDIHPKYDNSLLDYDAAILTLRKNIIFDSFRKAIKLPFLNQAIPVGTYVTTSGWGLTGNDSIPSSVLRMVELKIFDQVECFKIHLEKGGITTRMVCAAATSKDSCDGGMRIGMLIYVKSIHSKKYFLDSGGPLVDIKTRKLIGIVSFGLESGKCAIDGVPG